MASKRIAPAKRQSPRAVSTRRPTAVRAKASSRRRTETDDAIEQFAATLFLPLVGTLTGARTMQAILELYNRAPWLRAALDRKSGSLGAIRWHSYYRKGKNGGAVRDFNLQRGGRLAERKIAIFRGLQDGTLVEVDSHPILDTLHGGNPQMPGSTVRALSHKYLDLVGEMILLKQRVGGPGTMPQHLWPIPPTWVFDIPSQSTPRFQMQINGQVVNVDPSEVIYGRHCNPVDPYGRGTGAGFTLGDDVEMDEHGVKHGLARFRNRALPDIIVSPATPTAGAPPTASGESNADQMKRLEERWKQFHQGVAKAFRPFFTNRPINVHQLTQTLESLQFVDLRKFERDVVRQVIGIPPEIMGIVDQSNRATIDAAGYIYGAFCLVPACEFERELYQLRLVADYDDRLIIDYESPIGEDKAFKLETMKAFSWAFHSDEIREMAGFEPAGNPVYAIPINITLVSKLEPDPAPAPPATPVVDVPIEPDPGDDNPADDEVADDSTRDFSDAETRESSPGLSMLHRIQRKLAPKAKRLFLDAIRQLQSRVNVDNLNAALIAFGPRALDTISFNEWIRDMQVLSNGLHSPGVDLAGVMTAQQVSEMLGKDVHWNSQSIRAVEWVREHGAKFVTGVTGNTQQAIRDIMSDSLARGRQPRKIATMLQDVIGLNPPQAERLMKRLAELEAEGLPDEVVGKKISSMATKMHRQRARLVADHEAISAAGAGQKAMWDDAAANGLLDPNRTARMVIVTPDERLCPKCMPMDQQYRPLNMPFTRGDGVKVMNHPFHVKCRCGSRLKFVTPEEMQRIIEEAQQ